MSRRRTKRKNQKAGLDGSLIVFIILGSGLVALFSNMNIGEYVSSYKGELFASAVLLTIGLIFLLIAWYVVSAIRNYIRRWEALREFDFVHDLKIFQMMDPIEFEEYVAWLYRKQGYDAHTTRLQDEGIDVVMKKGGKKYAVQVKRYAPGHNVGQPTVRDFNGSFRDHFDEGILVTTSDFTLPARAWALTRPIQLINGTEFMRMVVAADDSEWKQESTLIGNETKSTVEV